MSGLPTIQFNPVGCHSTCRHEYGIHPHHRTPTPQKSQWTIDRPAETQVFLRASQANWLNGTKGWGLNLVNGSPDYLGVDETGTVQLFIARFEDSNATDKWHGYPMDHVRRSQDRPPGQVKQAWIDAGLLTPAKVRKVARGQPCTL